MAMARSKIWLTVSRLLLRPFLPLAVLARFLTWCFLFFLFLSCTEYFLGYSTAANQIIEACRQARRQAGFEIAPSAGRSLEEQLLAIQARLQPAHRLLRRLQRARVQVLAALWPGEVVPRTPSRTADWLEVAVGRFEAWKASKLSPAPGGHWSSSRPGIPA